VAVAPALEIRNSNAAAFAMLRRAREIRRKLLENAEKSGRRGETTPTEFGA